MTFMGLNGVVRMQAGVQQAEIHGDLVEKAQSGDVTGIVGVLGRGQCVFHSGDRQPDEDHVRRQTGDSEDESRQRIPRPDL